MPTVKSLFDKGRIPYTAPYNTPVVGRGVVVLDLVNLIREEHFVKCPDVDYWERWIDVRLPLDAPEQTLVEWIDLFDMLHPSDGLISTPDEEEET